MPPDPSPLGQDSGSVCIVSSPTGMCAMGGDENREEEEEEEDDGGGANHEEDNEGGDYDNDDDTDIITDHDFGAGVHRRR